MITDFFGGVQLNELTETAYPLTFKDIPLVPVKKPVTKKANIQKQAKQSGFIVNEKGKRMQFKKQKNRLLCRILKAFC